MQAGYDEEKLTHAKQYGEAGIKTPGLFPPGPGLFRNHRA